MSRLLCHTLANTHFFVDNRLFLELDMLFSDGDTDCLGFRFADGLIGGSAIDWMPLNVDLFTSDRHVHRPAFFDDFFADVNAACLHWRGACLELFLSQLHGPLHVAGGSGRSRRGRLGTSVPSHALDLVLADVQEDAVVADVRDCAKWHVVLSCPEKTGVNIEVAA